MKARQLDRSSKDVAGLKTQIKMTQQAPEVQKTCPASQMDQWTSQSRQWIGNGSFSESWKSKVNDIRSGFCHQEEEVKSTARTIQSRHLPSRSSTQGAKSTQVKQTVTMRQRTEPERCVNVKA
ncbi:unnamed protein product [Caenorhabditis nigoni]